jgi:hypothetical protein
MQNASNTVKANGCIRSKYGVFLEGINRDAGGRGGFGIWTDKYLCSFKE